MNKNKPPAHFASKYFDDIDELSETDNYFLPVIKDASEVIDFKQSSVLDVGCGTGIFLSSVIAAGCENCFGVDGPSEYAKRAISRGYKDVCIVDDLNNSPLPFSKESFDFVLCKDVFEHLLNPIYVLNGINRVLKEDGLFLFHVPNHFPLYGRLKFLFTNNIDTFSFFKAESRWTFPHIRFYEYSDCMSTLSQHGFIVERDLSFHFPAIPVFSRIKVLRPIMKYLVKKFPNQFAAGFTFLLSKKPGE